jgi:hypothetical protein
MDRENQPQPLVTPDWQVKKPLAETGSVVGNMPTQTVPAENAQTPQPAQQFSQKALRTYESDVADVLARKKISTTHIVLEENRKSSGEDRIGNTVGEQNEGQGETMSPEDRKRRIKNLLLSLGSLIFIGGGVIGAYYLYSLSPISQIGGPHQVQQIAPISVVPADSRAVIAIDGMSPSTIIKAVRDEIAKPQTQNTIKEIVLIQTKNGEKFRVNSLDAIRTMDIGIPDILNRSLGHDWMLGVYTDTEGKKDVFIISSVDYFQNAFSGMLQWENVMADDLKQYLYENIPRDISVAGSLTVPDTSLSSSSTLNTTTTTSRGTTTNSTQILTQPSPYTIVRGTFTDRIIQNKDVREFIANNNILFLYSFIDNTKLLITGSESTLREVLKRLEQNDFVR